MNRTKILGACLFAFMASAAHAQDTIKVGTEGDYAPFNYVTPDGKIGGFDYEIGQALCAQMKVVCQWSTNEWSGIIPALQTGKFDLMVASMAINEDRQKQVSFANPYYYNGMRFLTRKEAGIKDVSQASLKGKIIGTQSGSVATETLKEYFPDNDVKFYPSLSEALLDLESGRLDAVLESEVALNAWREKGGAECCAFVGDTFILDEAKGNAMAVRLGNEALLDRVNVALDAIMKDGTYETIRKKFFSVDIMQRPKNASEYLK